MAMPTDIEISEGSQADLDDLYARMVEDFPPEELKTNEQLRHVMSKGQYKLYLAHQAAHNQETGAHTSPGPDRPAETQDLSQPENVADNKVLGYAFVFEPPVPRIAWLDYLAVDPQFRGTGFGTQFFKKLCERMKTSRVGIMLEVEPVTSADETTHANQHRRINFYRRLGARRLDVEYLFPREHAPHPMWLLFRPLASMRTLPKEQIQEMIRAAYGYIHEDVKNREDILQSFIGNVRDNTL